jgi:hypothetical protein
MRTVKMLILNLCHTMPVNNGHRQLAKKLRFPSSLEVRSGANQLRDMVTCKERRFS